jgi:hypothetical protein
MESTSTRRTLEDRIENFIARFEAERRDPDWWEGDKLILALSFLKRGEFTRGESELRKADLPPESRAPDEVHETPAYPPLRIAEHRENFELAKATLDRSSAT